MGPGLQINQANDVAAARPTARNLLLNTVVLRIGEVLLHVKHHI